MTTLKPLSFVSVEGFWEKSVHDARMAEAAKNSWPTHKPLL